VVRDAAGMHEQQHAAVAVDVVVAAVAGAGVVEHALAVLARHRQVGQLGAVDHHQVDLRVGRCSSRSS
jgi:hypothetical protein